MKAFLKLFLLGFLVALVFFSFSRAKEMNLEEENQMLRKILKEKQEVDDLMSEYLKKKGLDLESEKTKKEGKEIGSQVRDALQKLWEEGGGLDFFATSEKASDQDFVKRAKKFKEEFGVFLDEYVEYGSTEKEEKGVVPMGFPPTEPLTVPEGLAGGTTEATSIAPVLPVAPEIPAPLLIPGMEVTAPTPEEAVMPPPVMEIPAMPVSPEIIVPPIPSVMLPAPVIPPIPGALPEEMEEAEEVEEIIEPPLVPGMEMGLGMPPPPLE